MCEYYSGLTKQKIKTNFISKEGIINNWFFNKCNIIDTHPLQLNETKFHYLTLVYDFDCNWFHFAESVIKANNKVKYEKLKNTFNKSGNFVGGYGNVETNKHEYYLLVLYSEDNNLKNIYNHIFNNSLGLFSILKLANVVDSIFLKGKAK